MQNTHEKDQKMLVLLNDLTTAYITKNSDSITINFINIQKTITIAGNITVNINLLNKLKEVI